MTYLINVIIDAMFVWKGKDLAKRKALIAHRNYFPAFVSVNSKVPAPCTTHWKFFGAGSQCSKQQV